MSETAGKNANKDGKAAKPWTSEDWPALAVTWSWRSDYSTALVCLLFFPRGRSASRIFKQRGDCLQSTDGVVLDMMTEAINRVLKTETNSMQEQV